MRMTLGMAAAGGSFGMNATMSMNAGYANAAQVSRPTLTEDDDLTDATPRFEVDTSVTPRSEINMSNMTYVTTDV